MMKLHTLSPLLASALLLGTGPGARAQLGFDGLEGPAPRPADRAPAAAPDFDARIAAWARAYGTLHQNARYRSARYLGLGKSTWFTSDSLRGAAMLDAAATLRKTVIPAVHRDLSRSLGRGLAGDPAAYAEQVRRVTLFHQLLALSEARVVHLDPSGFGNQVVERLVPEAGVGRLALPGAPRALSVEEVREVLSTRLDGVSQRFEGLGGQLGALAGLAGVEDPLRHRGALDVGEKLPFERTAKPLASSMVIELVGVQAELVAAATLLDALGREGGDPSLKTQRDRLGDLTRRYAAFARWARRAKLESGWTTWEVLDPTLRFARSPFLLRGLVPGTGSGSAVTHHALREKASRTHG